MFSREAKNKVKPKEGRRGKKSFKAAWETLLASQAPPKADKSPSRTRRGVSFRRGWQQDDSSLSSDTENYYDKLNSSVHRSTNGSLKLSGSFSKGSEVDDLWASSARAPRNGSPVRGGGVQTSPIDGEFQLHASYPPVPEELVTRILEGEYITFRELLPESLQGGNSNTNKKLIGQDNERIEDVSKWVDCMALYIAISSSKRPECARGMLAYLTIVTRLARESQDKRAWQRYDVAFRRKAFLTRLEDWGGVDENLWVFACSGDARKALLCKPCLSVAHDAESCPIENAKRKSTKRRGKWGSANKASMKESERPRSASPTRAARGPKEGLQLKFAFGYHGYNACNNLFYTQSNEIVFHTASLGIVYSPANHRQRFYQGHTDDILCLTIHDEQDYVATGQVGRNAETHVWDVHSLRSIAVLKGFHKRGIVCVDFSGDGKKLADVGLDDDHSICIWDWRKGEKLASTRGHKDVIFVLEWNPFNPNYFVSVGEKHIKFWTHKGSKIEKRPVTFGKAGSASTMMCVCHSPIDDQCFTGTDTGEVLVWQGTTLRRSVQAHKGAVSAMFSLLQTTQEGYVTGGRDGVVVMWDKFFQQCIGVFKVESASMNPGSVLLQDLPAIRSIHTDEGKILLGTGNDEIIEIAEDGKMTILVQGHGEGEVWGLDTHPNDDECITVSDDKTLRIWDLHKCRLKKVKRLKKGGRAVCYSPDGEMVAVGLNDGGFIIMDANSLEKVVSFKDRQEAISDIKFSPDGRFLAVGSHDNFVDIYGVKRGKRMGICKGNSSYVTHLDWDVQGKLIQTNSGAKEHLFFEAPHGHRKTLGAEAVERVDWASFTGVLGPTVKGIFPPRSDITDVNSTCRTKDAALLATGDDFGFVKVFDYPVSHRSARPRQYGGHSSHVTNVRWTHDDRVLVSTGGLDTSVLVWERLTLEPEVIEVDKVEDKVFVQPKFIPTGPIRNPIARGKSQWS